MEHKHSLATVVDCTQKGSVILTHIRLDQTDGSSFAPSSLCVGDPPRKPEAHPVLQLHRFIARDGDMFYFETYEEYEPQSELPSISSVFYFVGWWDKDQLKLAHSEPKDLTHYFFVSKSPRDHDHCYLCWQTISDGEGNDHEGYYKGKDFICIKCYEKYIVSGFGKRLGNAT